MENESRRCPSCELLFSAQDEPKQSFKNLYDDYVKLRQESARINKQKVTFRIVMKAKGYAGIVRVVRGTFTDKELAETIADEFNRVEEFGYRYIVLTQEVVGGRAFILDPDCPEDRVFLLP
jgi:hypothetical protein